MVNYPNFNLTTINIPVEMWLNREWQFNHNQKKLRVIFNRVNHNLTSNNKCGSIENGILTTFKKNLRVIFNRFNHNLTSNN